MAIIKNDYELSVWNEYLTEDGYKEEEKSIVIGAHDMEYLGRATELKFTTKINGTHSLTFQLISKFFDSKEGKFVENEFVDYLFNERKLKLFYKNNWYEFYIKSISEDKKQDTVFINYSCSDAFIEELSRNGYGITFDTELYNNVDEIGVFTEQILDGSIWSYNSKYNWGDFTEYTEEKLFKIPVSNFNSLSGYYLKFDCDSKIEIENAFNGKKRALEMGDDKARELHYFWDCGQYDEGYELTSQLKTNIENDGYIYVPYSCLSFCYVSESEFEATETPYEYKGNYALAPTTIDPSALIQFIAIPKGKEIEVDEEGLIINKDCHYVMTVEQWNSSVNSNKIYLFEDVKNKAINLYENNEQFIHGNMIVSYDGYLEEYGNLEIKFGKKISVTDRTECNISEEIDQYVKVYQNLSSDYVDEFSENNWCGGTANYRVCSKEVTRNIIPQLARNFVQNGTDIQSDNGWEVMKIYDGNDLSVQSAKIEVVPAISDEDNGKKNNASYLKFTPLKNDVNPKEDSYRTILNFGIVGQELKLTPDKTYCLSWNLSLEIGNSKWYIIIGEGTVLSSGEYGFKDINKILKFEGDKNSNLNDFASIFFKTHFVIENPYIGIYSENEINIYELKLFEAYTKGVDYFENGHFRYSGRDLFSSYTNEIITDNYSRSDIYPENERDDIGKIKDLILFEEDIMSGGYYTQTKYFIQQLHLKNSDLVCDTFGAKEYLNENGTIEDELKLPLDSSKFTEDNYEIITNYIDLCKCKYYDVAATRNEFDCTYGQTGKVCLYQKYGYCPYRFKTQKHCRKIRTLSGEKSNRFNLTQELSKIFEIYPMYYSKHNENGKIILDENGHQNKSVFYITEKGNEHHLGFKYKHNITGISRKKISENIVTKLYVNDVDSELSKTGMCSIKTAEDNPSKDNFIIDFSYYTKMGLLNEKQIEADLYGINESGIAFLKTLGYYNKNYDELTNNIINLENSSLNELEANLYVNLEGIETAQKELIKIKKQKDRFIGSIKSQIGDKIEEKLYDNETYKTYIERYNEQYSILIGLIKTTFYNYDESGFKCINLETGEPDSNLSVDKFLNDKFNIPYIKENWLNTHKYLGFGLLGQYNEEYNQIQEWKKERAKYLKWSNKLSLQFYQKYESYLKEGTWSDSNYLSDNCYYFGAKEVAKKGAIPKVEYNIQVIDLSALSQYNEYDFDVADVTFVEDENLIGINPNTGLPNKLKVLISETTHVLDNPTKDSIQVQNFTTQFQDLFQQVTSSVQSLSFNENVYKRASNFTSNQSIKTKSLQGALDNNDVTLINTSENNINIDATGQSGSNINNHSNKYKLDGQGLKFSNNGGQSWNVGVGPDGINADYIKVGSLDASKIQIVDGNYIYFLWDKSGITAYRNPQTAKENQSLKDYARFNRYGLTLSEGGVVRLRAGYEYSDKEELKGQSGNIGFYLYNDEGKVIFKTENSKGKTARLSLAGEIFATDKLSQIVIKQVKYKNGYSTRNAYLYSIENISTDSIEYKIIKSTNFATHFGSTDTFGNTETYEIGGQSYSVTMSSKKTQVVQLIEAERTKYFNAITVTAQYSSDGSNNIITIAYINNEYCILNKTDTLIRVIEEEIKETLYKDPVEITPGSINLFRLNGESYDIVTISNYYQFGTDSFFTEIEVESSSQELDESIGVFINNQHFSDNNINYPRRLICCAKGDGNTIKNVFSVTSSGELYIGGTITQHDKSGNAIEKKSIGELSDYISIEEDINTIKLDSTGLTMGGKSLRAYVQEQIQNASLPTHGHYIHFNDTVADNYTIKANFNGTDIDITFARLLQEAELKASTVIFF